MTTIATGPGVVERALLARRSQGRLLEPAPDDAALRRYLDAASSVADHGNLRPWRVVALLVRTGATVGAPAVRAFLGLAEVEKLLGWLYVRTPDPDRPASTRPRPDTADRLTVLAG